MSKRVEILLEDDLDGGSADETIHFGLDGVSYEIDLSGSNAGELREVMTPWVSAARTIKGRRAHKDTSSGLTRDQLRQVRAWAAEQGYNVSERGRIPRDILDAYTTADH